MAIDCNLKPVSVEFVGCGLWKDPNVLKSKFKSQKGEK